MEILRVNLNMATYAEEIRVTSLSIYTLYRIITIIIIILNISNSNKHDT